MHRTRIVIFLTFIIKSLSEKVTWLPNTSFNLPINFNNGKLPCSMQTVVFPETVGGAIRMESGTSIGGLILPKNGEIFLAEGVIELGPTEDNCKSGNVYYMQRSVASWADPDVWSSPKFNKATPDAERVPCINDVVEFPPDNTFTIILPDDTQSVEGIEVGGVSLENFDLREYIQRQSNEGQQFIFNRYQDTGIKFQHIYCKSRSGCPCQYNLLEIDCSVKFCEKPTCLDPIQPIGHCCKICGGSLAFDIDEHFDIMQFKELVEGIVETYGREKLVYHVGRLPTNVIQLVVVDQNDYDQTSAQVVNTISYNMERNSNQQMQLSGSPLDRSGFGGKMFLSMFATVVLVMSGIYFYYYKVPQVNYPLIFGRSRAGMFSRYNRRTESVVSLTRRDSVAPLGTSSATAFRNPLYDSKRGRVSVDESIIED